MKLVKYRIVKDNYAGYECQIWRLWFPFWVEMNIVNTHKTIEYAENYIRNNGSFVKYVDK